MFVRFFFNNNHLYIYFLEIYEIQDVINARNMLKCSIHRDQFCTDNRLFLKNFKTFLKKK